MDEIIPAPSGGSEVLDLGKVLGRREAMALVAGRCSASEAACLREVRESKQYRTLAPTWGQFCEDHLNMSKANADRLIRLLERFGPAYFEMSGLTRISPEGYARIADAVQPDGLHWKGEVIALLPENSERLSAAVKEFRGAPEKPARVSPTARLDALEKRSAQTAAEFAGLVNAKPGEKDLERLRSVLQDSITALIRVQIQLRG